MCAWARQSLGKEKSINQRRTQRTLKTRLFSVPSVSSVVNAFLNMPGSSVTIASGQGRTVARLGEETTLTFSERLREIRTGFERPFWVANISELFERLSYYAAFASLARYLHET